MNLTEAGYAGFWMRLAAWSVDSLLIRIPCIFLAIVIVLSTSLITDANAIMAINAGVILLLMAIPAIYGALFESSKLQATPGKLLLKLRVSDMNKQRCSFPQAFLRNICFALSDLTLGIGYLLLCWTKQKQCLHDKIAGCLVTKAN